MSTTLPPRSVPGRTARTTRAVHKPTDDAFLSVEFAVPRERGADRPPAPSLNATRMQDADGNEFDVTFTSRDRYYGGLYCASFRSASRLLRTKRVHGPERNILDWLLENLVGNKAVGAYQRRISLDTEIPQPHVSKYLTRLEDLGVVLRGDDPGEVLVHPLYFFMGSPRDQYAAWDDWQQRVLIKGARRKRGRQKSEEKRNPTRNNPPKFIANQLPLC